MQLQIQIQKNMQRRTHETLHSQVLFSLAGRSKYAKLISIKKDLDYHVVLYVPFNLLRKS